MRKASHFFIYFILAFLSFAYTTFAAEVKCEIISDIYSDSFVLIQKKPLTLGIIVKGSYTIIHKDGTIDGPHEGRKEEPHKGFLGMVKVIVNNFTYENITEREIEAAQAVGTEQFKRTKVTESCKKINATCNNNGNE